MCGHFIINRLKVADRRAPWVNASKATERSLVEIWENDDNHFRDRIVDELIKDALHAEVAGIASGCLAVSEMSFTIMQTPTTGTTLMTHLTAFDKIIFISIVCRSVIKYA